MIDESTGVSSKKYICTAIRYFSEKEEKIRTAFVELIPIISATGVDLFNALQSRLADAGLRLEICVGLASDGASTMVGEHDSVWPKVREASPNCTLMHCICHSLALCIKHAFEKMPSNLGFLLCEIPKWFSKSTLRRDKYKTPFETLNGDDKNVNVSGVFQTVCYPIACSWETNVQHTS